ncbi:uncharacterized protein At2g27730, mitochondrial [Beta vulgaris subsp. vulgaris]|uniref:uncharacterized protein At2g27730, mitochondrial n=1 Tax=Beta vulgaris subsp. vulgaris TaxID=3555 RepID=UPI0020371EFC|nr:uncharacterized protein At2g27730, mitochondrial [Beta vulgaris subsp. vulgaris]
MAGRIAARYVSRRFSSGGKVLSEEEKAAENVYIKKMEKEKLEKLARQGPKPTEGQATSSGAPATEAVKPSGPDTSAPKTSTDKHRNYAILAGLITAVGAGGWYWKSGSKKTEEVQD